MHWTFYVQTFVTLLVVRMCVGQWVWVSTMQVLAIEACNSHHWDVLPTLVTETMVQDPQDAGEEDVAVHKSCHFSPNCGTQALPNIVLCSFIHQSFFREITGDTTLQNRNSHHLTHTFENRSFWIMIISTATHLNERESPHPWLFSGVLSYSEVKLVLVMACSPPSGCSPWIVPSSTNGLILHSFPSPIRSL